MISRRGFSVVDVMVMLSMLSMLPTDSVSVLSVGSLLSDGALFVSLLSAGLLLSDGNDSSGDSSAKALMSSRGASFGVGVVSFCSCSERSWNWFRTGVSLACSAVWVTAFRPLLTRVQCSGDSSVINCC